MKKVIIIISIMLILLFIGGLSFMYFYDPEIPLDNTGFNVINSDVEIYSEVSLSSVIEVNGKLLDDVTIDTNELKTHNIKFLYENIDGDKRRGEVNINVVDTTSPIILLSDSYTVTVGYNKNLTDVILSADNHDSTPTREILGEYNYNVVGSYPLKYKITDASGNETIKDFTLNVKGKGSSSSYSPSTVKFSDIVSTHKNEKTKIGLDVSKWQGNIDFNALKNAGVEFIIIRVGTGLGFDEASIVDPYFKQNIEGAISAGIPVGVYYYSYANSVDDAKEQAQFVINQIKDYKIDLPIVFDWESWSYFNGLNLSINDINEIANTFLSEVEASGYKGMLYGSKYYLQNIWDTDYPVWLAHYTLATDYTGDYYIWQRCDTGRVSGIYGNVDINIMYEK